MTQAIDEYIQQLVAAAPPISEDQARRIGDALGGRGQAWVDHVNRQITYVEHVTASAGGERR